MRESRRRFLKTSTTAILGTPVFLGAGQSLARNAYNDSVAAKPLLGRVVVSRDPSYTDWDRNPAPVLDKGIQALLESDSATEGWRKLFGPDDVVAVKVNTLAGRYLSPGFQLVQAIAAGLSSAGVNPNRIIVWDRTSRELARAGYKLNTRGDGMKVFGTDALKNGYEAQLSHAYAVGSCFSRIISQYATAVINLSVMKDHDLAGISACLKNFYGVIHNPNKYHDNNCSPYVAQLNTHPYIRRKLRLNIIDAPLAQYHAGPAFSSSYTWTFSGLLLAVDSVAIDRLALDMIAKKRAEKGLKDLTAEKRYPAYIAEAGRLGLGEGTLERIRIMEV